MTGSMGVHILLNMYGCPKEALSYKEDVARLLNEVVKEADLHKVSESHFQFKPVGVTSVILLAESHISIHTWPEHQSAAVDIFCCSGKETTEKACALMLAKFKPSNHEKQVVER